MFERLSLRRKFALLLATFLTIVGGTIVVETTILNRSTELLERTNETAKAMRWLTMASIANHSLDRDLRTLEKQISSGKKPTETQIATLTTGAADLKTFVAQADELVSESQSRVFKKPAA